MEAPGKPLGFFTHDCEEQFSRPLRLFRSQILNVDLGRLVAELDLHLGASRAHPEKDVLAAVEDHDVVMGQVVLTKVCALLAHREVPLLVGAPEEPRLLHVVSLQVVLPPAADGNPPEVLWLLPLSYQLVTVHILQREQESVLLAFYILWVMILINFFFQCAMKMLISSEFLCLNVSL